MKAIRSGAVLVTIAVLGIIGAVIIKQHLRISSLRKSQRSLVAQNRGLSATNSSLVSAEAEQDDELDRLRQQPSEVLRLRSQLTQAWQQLASASAANQAPAAGSTNELAGYLNREQLRFVGFDTPENAFQSLNWAAMSGDYTNWLDALSPTSRETELADPGSLERFQTGYNKITGLQVLASKPVGNDRMELKVRIDGESGVAIFIFPMVAVGNEWRLGDDLEPYTRAWDSPGSTQ